MSGADIVYRLYTAVLREDKRNYAVSPAKRPRGKAEAEVKGTQGVLRCSVKNLHTPLQESSDTGYGIWIISEDGVNSAQRTSAFAGTLVIDKEGVGESSWKFSADNVGGSGLDIDSFNVLEVCVKTARNNVPGDRVLAGFLELEEVNLSEVPKMEKVAPFGAGLPYYQWWKFYPGYLPDWLYSPSVTGKATRNPLPGVQGEISGLVYGGLGRSSFPIPQLCLEDQGKAQTGPVFQGHQLVGLQCDSSGAVKYLVHGIPGRFCLRDQPYGGATGYIYWHPLPGQQYKAGEYGYWLIHINPKTGEVVFPQRATNPPDCHQCTRKMED